VREELDRKSGELVSVHRDACLKGLAVQTELAEKVEQVRRK